MTIDPIRLSLLAIVLVAQSAEACFCFGPERPCDIKASAAFVGHVTEVQRFGRGVNAGLRAHLIVKEAFRGVQSTELDVTTLATSCGVNFQSGRDYLVFAHQARGSADLETHACEGTEFAETAERKLEHLRAVNSGGSRSGIYGFVTSDPSDIVPAIHASRPLADVSINLRLLTFPDQVWDRVTDGEGHYEFDRLPAGRYRIAANPPNAPQNQTHFEVNLEAGACRAQAFLSVPASRISGVLIDSRDRPVSGVFVDIQAVPPTSQPRSLVRTPTDGNGRFVHEWLEAGEYILSINLASHTPIFYPGVGRRGDARTIKVDGGRDITGLRFRLASSLGPPGKAELPDKNRAAQAAK